MTDFDPRPAMRPSGQRMRERKCSSSEILALSHPTCSRPSLDSFLFAVTPEFESMLAMAVVVYWAATERDQAQSAPKCKKLPCLLRLAKSRRTVAPPQRPAHVSVGPKAPSLRPVRRSLHAGRKLVHGAVSVSGVCWARWHECRDLQRRPLACLARDLATPRTQSPKPRRQ